MTDQRLSIKALASYYEKEAETIKKSESKIIKDSPKISQDFEELLNTYKVKITAIENELQINTQKKTTLTAKIKKNLQNERSVLDKYRIGEDETAQINFDLLSLSSLQNEEISLLSSIYTYQQIMKNIIKNSQF